MTTPFKFLDAYGPKDKAIFFGRDDEIEELYRLVFQTRLLLVYGQTGTGKTSLVQCGLANRFDKSDWFEVFVRRKDDLNASLDQEIRRHARTPIKAGADVVAAVRCLYFDHLRPVYLIFDQFEELFILGSAEEQQAFIDSIAALLDADVACKVVFVMREEYLAMLQPFEKAVPSLFDKRLRVEPMAMRNVRQVIAGTTGALGIGLEHGEATAKAIIDNLTESRAGVQLSYLQVYLDKLYRSAAPGSAGAPVVFTDALVAQTGALGDVLADFLEEQTAAIQAELAEKAPAAPAGTVQRILEEFTTLEGTKAPLRRDELASRLPAELAPFIDACLAALEQRRLIRNVDGLHELAHDTLARRIADKRSGERKALLKVQKLVHDQFTAYEQTKTLMNAEELALARPVLAQLGLSAEEAAFVARSERHLRNRRVGIVASTALLVVVLASLTVWAMLSKQRADRAIALAGDVTNELSLTIVERLREVPKTQAIRHELLTKADIVSDELARGGGKPNDAAPFWRQVLEGDIALERGELAAARQGYEKSAALAEKLAGTNPPPASWQRNLSVALGRLGKIDADTDPGRARQALAKALAIDEGLVQREPGNLNWKRDLAVSYGQLGALAEASGDVPEASRLQERALTLAEELAAKDPTQRDWQRDLAVATARVGGLAKLTQNFDRAREMYTRSAAVMTRLTGAEPENLAWQGELASLYYNLGEVALEKDQAEPARAASDQALAVAPRLADVERERMLSVLERQRAEIELLAGQPARARESALRAVEAARHLEKIDASDAETQRLLGLANRQLAATELAGCNLDAARTAAQQSLAVALRLRDAHPAQLEYAFDVSSAHEKLGTVERHARRPEAARKAVNDALAVATDLASKVSGDAQLAQDIERLRQTLRDIDAGMPPAPPAGCPAGSPTAKPGQP